MGNLNNNNNNNNSKNLNYKEAKESIRKCAEEMLFVNPHVYISRVKSLKIRLHNAKTQEEINKIKQDSDKLYKIMSGT